MLLIEIILTIFAWRNGWKWLSLIPVGAAVLIGMIIGYSVGMSGGTVDVYGSGLFIFDILAIIALIVMVVKKKEIKES
jgi:purine-cytosine permease-like protein